LLFFDSKLIEPAIVLNLFLALFGETLYFCSMLQQILLIASVAGAVFYLSRQVYKSFQAKNACATGCGKCAASNAAASKANA
jgi:hypothetical protein